MNKNKIAKAVLLSLGLTSLIGCGEKAEQNNSDTKSSELAKEQIIVRGNGTEVSSLDPHKAEGVPESHVLRDLMEGLVIQDSEGNIIPGSAESWKNENNQRFTFKIRPDAKWSNGDTLTAYDFEYSFKRAVSPKTAAPYASVLEKAQIINAKDIISGKKGVDSLGVTAIDDTTLVIETAVPLPYFLQMLTHTVLSPVHAKTIEKYGESWAKPEHFVSNGAYKLKEWVVNEKIVLERSQSYWNNSKTQVDKVVFLPIESQNAEMNRFLAGEIDITNELPSEQFQRLKKEYPDFVVVSPLLCTYYYAFNTQKTPFNDVRVRHALSYLIDRNVVANALLGQGQKPAYSLTHSGVTGFRITKPEYANLTIEQQQEKAQALLRESGYNETNPLKFTLLYNTNENHKKIATAIQAMWSKKLGKLVNVTLENQEWKTYLANRKQGNFDVARAGWCADYNEPSAFLSLAMTGHSSNDMKYSSSVFDKAMNNALYQAKTEQDRGNYYLQAEEQLAKDMAIAPIYEYVQARLVSNKIKGFPYNNPQFKIYTKDMRVLR